MVQLITIPFDACGLGHGQGARHAPEAIRKRLDELYAIFYRTGPLFNALDLRQAVALQVAYRLWPRTVCPDRVKLHHAVMLLQEVRRIV